ncbi:MAG: phosphate ABC transporter permease subunit PstC [Aestuariivirga sp.]
MSSGNLLILILVLSVAAYFVGRFRANAISGKGEKLHSLPSYHGFYFAIATGLLPVVLLGLCIFGSAQLIRAEIDANLPAEVKALAVGDQSLSIGAINSLAPAMASLSVAQIETLKAGGDAASALLTEKKINLASAPQAFVVDAALQKSNLMRTSALGATLACLLLAALGFAYAWMKDNAAFRSRNAVETILRYVLMAASSVAVLTTIGIVASVLFESLAFFKSVPVFEFLFGTVWDPRFAAAGNSGQSGQFGLLPLLWGTFFITIVALLVAVPVGLTAAIYMSEYASSKVRGFAKPALEVLAGIPTIVYGFFALTTFGPFLHNAGAGIGLNISPNSVLSAGFVMGVMIIPFVSSLSDDILSAVPNSLREGSYGLGATQSETIKKVVLPAALPGIVGAVLLAVSRAVGETMIVVLAAGIAANLTLNPFQPVTTITVKIVSQLTGDLEFNSPQTLVAFALGLTLFIFTLGLNIIALSIVRKYREQYE